MEKKPRESKRLYFTKVHEEAILQYALSKDRYEKEKLYATLIQPAFDEMVNKIVFTYKFNTLPNIDDLRDECKIWLTTILDKFDESRGYKAFSYFSVITKNWFIQKIKKNTKRLQREVNCDDVHTETENDEFVTHNTYEEDRDQMEFWIALTNEIEDWKHFDDLKEIEVKTVLAIQDLMSNIDSLEIFNKKAIYLYLREISGLNTKQLVASLSSLKAKYKDFRQDWLNGDY